MASKLVDGKYHIYWSREDRREIRVAEKKALGAKKQKWNRNTRRKIEINFRRKYLRGVDF